MAGTLRTRRRRIPRVRDHDWSPPRRAVFIAALTIVMGSLFLTTYTLALGDPMPRRIDAALVGDPAQHARTLEAVEQVAAGNLDFRQYESVTAARHAIDLQRVYAALDLTSARPTLYVASAAGASGEAAVHVQQFADLFHGVRWIGPLFLANAVAIVAVISALALGSLVLCCGQGLFGWQEAGFRTPVAIAVIAEVGAVVLLTAALAGDALLRQR